MECSLAKWFLYDKSTIAESLAHLHTSQSKSYVVNNVAELLDWMPFTFIKKRGMLPNGSYMTNQQLLKALLTYIPVNRSKQCGRMATSNAFHIYKDTWNAAKSFSYSDTVNVSIGVVGKVNLFLILATTSGPSCVKCVV